ncbi:putative holin-like toxin [Cohnella thailandensis]|uniref:putative holin-like toxin n=1 Tax=Cohnella thailandensis TaxID=557557 RepID=UPI003CCCDF39
MPKCSVRVSNPQERIVRDQLTIIPKSYYANLAAWKKADSTPAKGGVVVDLFQSLSVIVAFGLFLISLLTYIEKRK